VREEQKPADPEKTGGRGCDASDKEGGEKYWALLGHRVGREGGRVEMGLLDRILEYPVVSVSFSFLNTRTTWYMYLPYI
jgi:hypothetical protein